MDFSFFTTNNKSGYKTKELWFSKNHKDVYDKIIKHSITYDLNNHSFKEKIWNYFHNITQKPKCLYCEKTTTFADRFDRGYNKFCSLKCANDSGMLDDFAKIKMKEKWGVDYFSQHHTYSEKVKKTKLEKYGDENYTNIEKLKKTKLERYGDENYCNVEKGKQTSLERYGVSNPSKSKIIKDKIVEVNLKKWGYITPILHPEIKHKRDQSVLKNIKKRFEENEFISYNQETKEFILFCKKCNSEYIVYGPFYNSRRKCGYETCILCNPIDSLSSHREKEVYNYVLELGVEDAIENDRKLIKPLELDVYIPKHKLAIEFNGVHYHSDLFKNDDYHLNKYKKCLYSGVELIQIFEDEWLYKKDIIKSIIKNRLKMSEYRIFARNCIVSEIDKKTCEEFLEKNHIEGYCPSKIRLGLFHNELLVSVMAFNNKNNNSELLRFCNLINHNIIGSGSKLFNYYIKHFNPIRVLTNSDNRLFNGNLFKKLGFIEIEKTKPNYWYVIQDIRFDKKDKTIMSERGFKRIYDCGVTRWEWKNS